jgi:hypothetical protein
MKRCFRSTSRLVKRGTNQETNWETFMIDNRLKAKGLNLMLAIKRTGCKICVKRKISRTS